MYDFGKIVYLDFPETGVPIVRRFLSKTCKSTLLSHKSTKGLVAAHVNAFHFTTIRHPLSMYAGLFRRGLNKKGRIFNVLAKSENYHLYQKSSKAFENWLAFILDSKNTHLFGSNYSNFASDENLGLLSYRYLMLCTRDPQKNILQRNSEISLPEAIKRHLIINHIVHSEKIHVGLIHLATDIIPEFFDQAAVKNYSETLQDLKRHSSKTPNSKNISQEIIDMLNIKEKILISYYSGTETLSINLPSSDTKLSS